MVPSYYISSTRPSILGLANRLCGTGVNSTTKPRIEDTDKEVTSFGGNGETGPENLSRAQLLQEDSNVFDEMEKDVEMFQQAEVLNHTILKDQSSRLYVLYLLLKRQTSLLKLY